MKGGNLLCISEKSRKKLKSLYLSRGMEECLRSSGKTDSYQTRREGNRVFLVQRSHNSHGRFVKVV